MCMPQTEEAFTNPKTFPTKAVNKILCKLFGPMGGDILDAEASKIVMKHELSGSLGSLNLEAHKASRQMCEEGSRADAACFVSGRRV